MKNAILLLLFMAFISCESTEDQQSSKGLNQEERTEVSEEQNRTDFLKILDFHLQSVSEKNLENLAQTLSPDSIMILILPQTIPTYAAKDFLAMHEAWFKDANWTFETKVLEHEISDNLGIAIVDVMYKEPERNGKPYFNHMVVSYGLKKIGGKWYVFKDHACSIEKTEI